MAATEMANVSSGLPAGRTVGVHRARGEWSELVAEAKDGSPVTLTLEDDTAAVLAPLTWLEAAAGVRTGVVETPVSEARKRLGELVKEAAQGVPQVLTRYGHHVAVLMPGPDSAGAPPAPAPPVSGRRRLVSAGDVLSARPPAAYLSFGLPALDAVARGISAGRLTLVAGEPGVGASLLAVAAARQTALVEESGSVLYAASGPGPADVVARLVASHAGVSYHQWRAGTLPEPEAAAARLAEAVVRGHGGDTLWIDAGPGLDSATISEVVLDGGWARPLALVVVDRLQHTADDRLPLSGAALEGAVRELAHLARQGQVPVLAVLDSADAHLVASLDADVTLTLTRMGQAARIDVAERGMGRLTSIAVEPDIPRARFLALPDHIAARLLREDTSPVSGTATQEAPPVPAVPDEAGTAAAPQADERAAQQPAGPGARLVPAGEQHRPGAWPVDLAGAGAGTARPGAPDTAAAGASADPPAAAGDTASEEHPATEAGEELIPDDERKTTGAEYGPFAVIDGHRRAHLAGGKTIPCPATSVRELVTWAADRPFGTPRLHPSGRDGDPLIVLTAEAVTALGLPDREDAEERALPVDHPVIADLAAHGWEMPKRGNKPWFSAWVRLFQRVDRGRRSVQLAVLPWGALTTGGWPLPVDPKTRQHLYTAADVVRFLSVYSDRVMTPVSSTAVTGQELMSALRPATRAWRDQGSGKVRSKWIEGSLHLPVDPAPPEATRDHPLAAGRDEKDPAQVLQEEALKWWRMPTEEERRLPFVVGLDTVMAFFAACNGTPMGTCAPYEVQQPRFDKKIPGSWLEDLSGVDTDPLLPSPFTPDGSRPTGRAWYETHTIALAAELGHTPRPVRGYLRPSQAQARAMGLAPHPDRYDDRRPDAGPVPAFGQGPYLKPWYEHLNKAYMQTMTALEAVAHPDGTPLSPQEFLEAMARMQGTAFRAEHATDLLVLTAIKQTIKGAIGKYRQGPQDYGRRAEGANARWNALDRPDWRPDHRAATLARYRAVMNRKIIATAKAIGARPLAVNTDCIVFASPVPDIMWLTGHKSGFTIGPNPGRVKLEGVQSMDWYLQVAALNKNPASRIKDGRTDAALEGK